MSTISIAFLFILFQKYILQAWKKLNSIQLFPGLVRLWLFMIFMLCLLKNNSQRYYLDLNLLIEMSLGKWTQSLRTHTRCSTATNVTILLCLKKTSQKLATIEREATVSRCSYKKNRHSILFFMYHDL